MKKEPNFLLSPTLGIIKVFVTIYPVYFRFLLCYNDQDERQKYGIIEDSSKKSRAILFARQYAIYVFIF